MMQFYLLSILANIFASLALSVEYLGEKIAPLSSLKEFFSSKNVRVGAGSAAAIIGFLKLLIRSTAGEVPLVGDFLPALAGLSMGAVLLFDVYKDRTKLSEETITNIEKSVLTYRVPLGLGGIVISLLHFLLPGALFL